MNINHHHRHHHQALACAQKTRWEASYRRFRGRPETRLETVTKCPSVRCGFHGRQDRQSAAETAVADKIVAGEACCQWRVLPAGHRSSWWERRSAAICFSACRQVLLTSGGHRAAECLRELREVVREAVLRPNPPTAAHTHSGQLRGRQPSARTTDPPLCAPYAPGGQSFCKVVIRLHI